MDRNTPASMTKCFDEHEEASFQTYRHFMQGNASMCTKEGKVFFAFGSKDMNFVHSKAIRTWMQR
jgi:hypothetical protein